MSKIVFIPIFTILSSVICQLPAKSAIIIGADPIAPDSVCSSKGIGGTFPNYTYEEEANELMLNPKFKCIKTFTLKDTETDGGDINNIAFTIKNVGILSWTDYHFEILGNTGAKFVNTVTSITFNNCTKIHPKKIITQIDCNNGTVPFDNGIAYIALSIKIPNNIFGKLQIANLATRSTPEYTSAISIFVLGTLSVASTLKRKLKPSKSSEKKLEKVS